MYEIQFKKTKPNNLSLNDSSYSAGLNAQSVDHAFIIFDENKKCLFFSPEVEYILGDHLNILLLEAWIISLEDDILHESLHFLAEEISFLINSIGDLEILVNKIKISDNFWQQFDNLQRVTVNESEIEDTKRNCNYLERQNCMNIVQNKLLRQTFYDQLTRLPNYNLLLEYIKKSIGFLKQQQNYIFVILFLDINRFKVINNSLGRILGDKLLIAIAQRLKRCLRSQDFIARIGSDEFAILLSNINNINYAQTVAERLYKELIVPFDIDGYEIFVEVSIGIAVGTQEYNKPEDLLRDAELAMSEAKKHNKSHYQLFNQSMHRRAMTTLQLENDLRKAIKRQEFVLHYQPIVSLVDSKMKGFEVLVRWQHPEKGLVSPGEFIPLAEDSGLIVSLGAWVLREACLQMRNWQLQFTNISSWKISVNISSKQLAQPNFVEQVKQILQETQLSANNLKLEVTESCLVEDSISTIAILKELKALGIEFSLDDFGTGYSSLSYLHQFPFDTLKIDRSFVNSIEGNSEKLGIIRAIITLARNLGMDTIAEGIETINQLNQLKALKCQYAQGYFLSKPLNKEILENLIVTEISDINQSVIDNNSFMFEEQVAQEKLLLQIESLRQQLEELKQEKADLEIMLDTTTEHSDLVEAQLQNEISDRRKAQAALHQANQELEKLSALDSLTQVANRRRFDDYLLQEWQKLRQRQASLSLILCDIDYFKLYNDNYGHPIGDYCLQQVALAIECAMESYEGLVARYGGEEFAVILPGMDGEQALQVAENIKLSVNKLNIAHQKSPINQCVTLSLGVFSVVPNPQSSPELLIACADKALYEAKAQGRNKANLFVI
jgi:diguanylate cyclase (GGDEF)-like protein